jgi:hypothetical protein
MRPLWVIPASASNCSSMVKLDMTDCVEQFTVIGDVVNDGAATACCNRVQKV